MTAVNARTGNQTTTYTWGSTLAESGVARMDLLRQTTYPGTTATGWANLTVDQYADLTTDAYAALSVDAVSDVTQSAYNRLEQRHAFFDQRGTLHLCHYDKLGRLTNDCVNIAGSGTDVTVRQIITAYEVRGMVSTVTSTSSPVPGGGTVLNQVAMTYNDFGQLVEEEQAHGGAVGSSPSVQYGYATGGSSSNQIRPTRLTYPDSRQIDYDYGTGGGPDDRLSRVNAIRDGGTSLAAYTYLGSGTVVRIDYTQPDVMLDLWGGTTGVFAGFDRFGRIVDQRWLNYTTPADLDRYKYGYDRDSNRTWKQNTVGSTLDEYYTYDQLNRLATMDRGTLTGSPPSGISGTPVKEQDWTLDPTGNWRGYLTRTSGTTDLNQSRASNTVNQITAITETTGPSWIDPAYDPAGNTTTFPQGADPTKSFTATYDAWNRD